MQTACGLELNNVAITCHRISRDHALEFIALPNTWDEYLHCCEQIISLYGVAHHYAPGERTIIENVIYLCRDNIEGVKYNDPYQNVSASAHCSDQREKEIRAVLISYAQKMRILDPNYTAPNPQRQTAGNPQRQTGGCFIVTATLGDEGHPDVLFLRSFRDDLLVKSKLGLAFVAWYSRYGPMVANRIRDSAFARSASYLFVVVPAVGLAKVVTRLSRR